MRSTSLAGQGASGVHVCLCSFISRFAPVSEQQAIPALQGQAVVLLTGQGRFSSALWKVVLR